MTDVLITSFPITGLEYVFVPPGLPLITKTIDAPATTSILIRGGAGAGKTTLAAALAHAIAREQKGVALYLTTEFVATELTYKAKTLGLPASSVASWQSRKEHAVGTILAEHLLRTAAGAEVKTVAQRKRAAIDAVWELLANGKGEPSALMQVGPPVRAVVIDAFGLPEIESDNEHELRNELLGLVQTLELAGITTILIEEAGTRGEAWLPFIVDLVFELDLWPDPETGELSRRLKCPKNRYGQSIPGPHDYGMDSDSPSVWPDLTSVGGTHASLVNKGNLPPALFFPLAVANQYLVCSAGSVILSAYDSSPSIASAFLRAPGLRFAVVNCGPLTRIRMPRGTPSHVPENEGPFALAWLLLRAYGVGAINSVFLQEFEFFLSRPRLRVGALRMLEMLRTAGLTVCLNGRAAELAPAIGVANYVYNGKYSGSLLRKLPAEGSCSATRWLAGMEERIRAEEADAFYGFLVQMIDGTQSPDSILSAIDKTPAASGDPRNAAALCRRASTLCLLGASGQANGLMSSVQPTNLPSVVARLRFHLLAGNDMAAANECLSFGEAFPEVYAEVWTELSAIYAQNKFAIEQLAQVPNPPAHTLAALLRALAAGEQFERVAQLVDARGEQFKLPAWFIARLKADCYLEASSASAWELARAGLSLLAEDMTLPPVHHAEVFYNLGVAKSRLGDASGAQDAYRQAIACNPCLEVAATALAEGKR